MQGLDSDTGKIAPALCAPSNGEVSRLESLPAEVLQIVLGLIVSLHAPVVWLPEPRLRLQVPALAVSRTIRDATIKALYDECSFAFDDPHDLQRWLTTPRSLRFDLTNDPHPIIPRCIMLSICRRMAEYTPKVNLDWDNADEDYLRAGSDDLDDWKRVWRSAFVKIPFRRKGQDEEKNVHHRVTRIVLDVSLYWLYSHPDNVNLYVGFLSMAVHMRSKGGCSIQIVGCKDRKDQETFETYVPEKQLCRTGKEQFNQFIRRARTLEENQTAHTFFGSMFGSP